MNTRARSSSWPSCHLQPLARSCAGNSGAWMPRRRPLEEVERGPGGGFSSGEPEIGARRANQGGGPPNPLSRPPGGTAAGIYCGHELHLVSVKIKPRSRFYLENIV